MKWIFMSRKRTFASEMWMWTCNLRHSINVKCSRRVCLLQLNITLISFTYETKRQQIECKSNFWLRSAKQFFRHIFESLEFLCKLLVFRKIPSESGKHNNHWGRNNSIYSWIYNFYRSGRKKQTINKILCEQTIGLRVFCCSISPCLVCSINFDGGNQK